MIREIILCGQKVNYTLQYKNVKNINLRIHEDGTIFVSASKRVKLEKIDAFLLSKGEWIITSIEKMKRRAERDEASFDAESILLLGKRVPLIVSEGNKNTFFHDTNGLRLVLKDINDTEKKEKLLKAFYMREAERVIFPMCEIAYKRFAIKNLAFPEIKYRYMKTRWGSCHTKKKMLTFNSALAKAPVCCIEYVVFHEFSHFLHPNHSKAFYETLSSFMPDYKVRRKLLKDVPI